MADDVISLCCTEYKKYEEIFPEGSKSELEMEMSQHNLCKLVSLTDFLRITKYLCFYYPVQFPGEKIVKSRDNILQNTFSFANEILKNTDECI